MKKHIVFIILFLLSNSLHAAEYWRTGKVSRVLSTTGIHGGCMVLLDTQSARFGCPKHWVSLDCSGEKLPKEDAERNYATALIASSLQSNISILVSTEKTASNYCIAKRVMINN